MMPVEYLKNRHGKHKEVTMNTFYRSPSARRGKIAYTCTSMVLLCFILAGAGVSAADKKEITREQAWEIVKKEILKDPLKDKAVYISEHPLKANDTIKSWEKVITVPGNFQRCWLVFVDDQYGANWQHKCRYIFVDTASGKYEVIKSLAPPDSMEGMKQIFPEK
jgi:hypothetical protein